MIGVATIRCYKCHEFVRVIFTRVIARDGNWWEGRCTHCGAPNLVRKPGWTKEVLQKGGQN